MSNKKQSSLRDFMSDKQREAMKGLPTYHANCLKKTGVARPGKTAKEKAKKLDGHKANRVRVNGPTLFDIGKVRGPYH